MWARSLFEESRGGPGMRSRRSECRTWIPTSSISDACLWRQIIRESLLLRFLSSWLELFLSSFSSGAAPDGVTVELKVLIRFIFTAPPAQPTVPEAGSVYQPGLQPWLLWTCFSFSFVHLSLSPEAASLPFFYYFLVTTCLDSVSTSRSQV